MIDKHTDGWMDGQVNGSIHRHSRTMRKYAKSAENIFEVEKPQNVNEVLH